MWNNRLRRVLSRTLSYFFFKSKSQFNSN
jgi:hypothetical protein